MGSYLNFASATLGMSAVYERLRNILLAQRRALFKRIELSKVRCFLVHFFELQRCLRAVEGCAWIRYRFVRRYEFGQALGVFEQCSATIGGNCPTFGVRQLKQHAGGPRTPVTLCYLYQRIRCRGGTI